LSDSELNLGKADGAVGALLPTLEDMSSKSDSQTASGLAQAALANQV
jgi:hypothetical protein